MTENPQQSQRAAGQQAQVGSSGQPQDTEQAVRQAGQPATSHRAGANADAGTGGSDQPETFADGSTREQQQQRIREAEEANAATKAYADEERQARQDQSG